MNAELIDALRTDIREVEDDSVKTLSLMWRAADALAAADKRIVNLLTALHLANEKGVLPDEHGDLVDRDEALNDIKRFICNGCNRETEDDCVACITKGIEDILCGIKPIIAAERSKHGNNS